MQRECNWRSIAAGVEHRQTLPAHRDVRVPLDISVVHPVRVPVPHELRQRRLRRLDDVLRKRCSTSAIESLLEKSAHRIWGNLAIALYKLHLISLPQIPMPAHHGQMSTRQKRKKHLVVEEEASRAERGLHQLPQGRPEQQVCRRRLQRPSPPKVHELCRAGMLAAHRLEDAPPGKNE